MVGARGFEPPTPCTPSHPARPTGSARKVLGVHDYSRFLQVTERLRNLKSLTNLAGNGVKLGTERLTRLPDGRLAYSLEKKWSDGTTAVVLSPEALLERLAALVPRPRFPLVTYLPWRARAFRRAAAAHRSRAAATAQGCLRARRRDDDRDGRGMAQQGQGGQAAEILHLGRTAAPGVGSHHRLHPTPVLRQDTRPSLSGSPTRSTPSLDSD